MSGQGDRWIRWTTTGCVALRRAGVLPWALLVAGSVASLAANVAVAEPTVIGRVIAAWPSFALTASYELLTRQVRRSASADDGSRDQRRQPPLDQLSISAASQVGTTWIQS